MKQKKKQTLNVKWNDFGQSVVECACACLNCEQQKVRTHTISTSNEHFNQHTECTASHSKTRITMSLVAFSFGSLSWAFRVCLCARERKGGRNGIRTFCAEFVICKQKSSFVVVAWRWRVVHAGCWPSSVSIWQTCFVERFGAKPCRMNSMNINNNFWRFSSSRYWLIHIAHFIFVTLENTFDKFHTSVERAFMVELWIYDLRLMRPVIASLPFQAFNFDCSSMTELPISRPKHTIQWFACDTLSFHAWKSVVYGHSHRSGERTKCTRRN